jgi:mRNA-degrading endonuclease toxin of MazEF toxin-antitoxin module
VTRDFVTIAPASRTIRSIEAEVLLLPDEGMPARSAVNLDDIQTIDKARINDYITTLAPHKMLEVERAIHFALALSA